MRLPATCWGCISENIVTEKWVEPERYLLELRDDGAYVGTCGRGHTQSFAVQNLRHEVLYEAGGVALLCGFHREAVASIATALERFHEFALYVLAEHQGASPGDLQAAWKDLSRKSERQFGAFVFAYLMTFKRPFPQAKKSRGMVEFRNDVVHNGRIPTRDEALQFAESVFEIVRDLAQELETLDPGAVAAVRKRLLVSHDKSLEKRLAVELPASKKDGFALHYGMMLHSWKDHRSSDEFVWNLEALAYRIKRSGAGILFEDKPFTRFEPPDDAADEER